MTGSIQSVQSTTTLDLSGTVAHRQSAFPCVWMTVHKVDLRSHLPGGLEDRSTMIQWQVVA